MRTRTSLIVALLAGCNGPSTDDKNTDPDPVDTDTVDTDTVDTDTDTVDTDPVDTDTVDTDLPSDPCVWTRTSTLAGASITAPDMTCTYSIPAADAGVDVPWTLTITESAELYVDLVSCAPTDPSGLRFSE